MLHCLIMRLVCQPASEKKTLAWRHKWRQSGSSSSSSLIFVLFPSNLRYIHRKMIIACLLVWGFQE
ncbi:hypothetical protein DERP_008731 [Dermatophagoides pteronyssinus]|uniref:Uncharacterized protein n=1 Tax=Dermatophagoides pteronyssinus TaxID=6956 RepID=A0ABQ8IWG5_DERPT|nr:hypothetical protein DERP_008731 [Dermatophagoides pteronyssinus]